MGTARWEKYLQNLTERGGRVTMYPTGDTDSTNFYKISHRRGEKWYTLVGGRGVSQLKRHGYSVEEKHHGELEKGTKGYYELHGLKQVLQKQKWDKNSVAKYSTK